MSDCILAFSFGYREENGVITPGISNEDIAAVLADHFAAVPKILQWEIAGAYKKINPDEHVWMISRHRIADAYLDTREVADQARDIMRSQGWKTAALVGHPAHMPRIGKVCEKLGIIIDDADQNHPIRYDPLSAQIWTRDDAAWNVREKMAMEYYRQKGWI